MGRLWRPPLPPTPAPPEHPQRQSSNTCTYPSSHCEWGQDIALAMADLARYLKSTVPMGFWAHASVRTVSDACTADCTCEGVLAGSIRPSTEGANLAQVGYHAFPADRSTPNGRVRERRSSRPTSIAPRRVARPWSTNRGRALISRASATRSSGTSAISTRICRAATRSATSSYPTRRTTCPQLIWPG